MLEKDLVHYTVTLPADVQRYVLIGQFDDARAAIDRWLERRVPFALKKRLQLERDRIAVLQRGVYPFSEKDAVARFTQAVEGATPEEFARLKDEGHVEWIFVEGVPHMHVNFLENLIKTIPDLRDRAKAGAVELLDLTPQDKRAFYDENLRLMKKQGRRKARVRIKAAVEVAPHARELGKLIRVHVPVAREEGMISQVTIESLSSETATVSRADSLARTAFFEETLTEESRFEVEYSYDIEMNQVTLDPDLAEPCDVAVHLREHLPHYAFTPYLRSLANEIVGQETNPVKQARAIYDFITTTVEYSLMPPYATIPSIAEYAAANLKGDCGVQAILFVALCRIVGIPARWESGLSVRPLDGCHCHDWARFYVKPFGWRWVDPSFGGSAYREGDLERWNYYFGNLDIFRMASAGALGAEFVPAKRFSRIDPTDNQQGEAEYEDRALRADELVFTHELVSFEECDLFQE